METIKLGSIESLVIVLDDRLGNVDDLNDVTNLRFDVRRKDDASLIQSNVGVVVDTTNPMRAVCEIDTTVAAYLATEDIEYGLYLKYTSGSESPIMQPVRFRVTVD